MGLQAKGANLVALSSKPICKNAVMSPNEHDLHKKGDVFVVIIVVLALLVVNVVVATVDVNVVLDFFTVGVLFF